MAVATSPEAGARPATTAAASMTAAAAVEAATEVADAIRPLSSRWDAGDAFPAEALDLLRASGLMGLMAPRRYGGLGGGAAELSACARIIAGADLSTAMVWSMHCQQVAVIARHAPESLRQRLLNRIATGEVYVASATTEPGKGGHLLSAVAALRTNGAGVRLSRRSPVVTGGEMADGFLMTLRRSADGDPSDVVMVYADRQQLSVEKLGDWEMLGMRGTQSVPMQLDGAVPPDQVIDPPHGFARLAAATMIPVGHVAWCSSWLGAADEALRAYVRLLRTPRQGPSASSLDEIALSRLARVRLRLDVADAYLRQVVRHCDQLLATPGEEPPGLAGAAFDIEVNNLKVVVSEESFRAVDELMTVAGLPVGYSRRSTVQLERAFRDLRSAALMYANDRLLAVNGRLCLVDSELRRVGDSPPASDPAGASMNGGGASSDDPVDAPMNGGGTALGGDEFQGDGLYGAAGRDEVSW